jgi:hypothetical protein
MFKINWVNTTENLVQILISTVFGVFIGHKITVSTNNTVVDRLKPIINKAIDKETVKNEVNNEINTRKIKNAKDLSLVLKPNNNQKATVNNSDLFCIDTTKLSKSENRRLKKWLK